MKDYKVDKASLSASFCQEVYQVVREIPVGKVSTYGGIVALLGIPQCSRMVGRALKQIPDDLSAPCHRVVNASGRLVPGWTEQKQLFGRRDLFQAKWMRRLEKASLELLRI